MIKKYILFSLFTLVKVAASNPYEVQTTDKAIQISSRRDKNKKKVEGREITFTFLHNKKPLTWAEVIALRKNYDKDVEEMFIDFARQIHQVADQHQLWEGFKLKADIPDKLDTSFAFVMRGGKCGIEKQNPKKRKDPFMHYTGQKKDRYQEIRASKPSNPRFKNAFDEHLNSRDEQTNTFLVNSFTGKSLVLFPRTKATTIYDLSQDGKNNDITYLWKSTLCILNDRHTDFKNLSFNTGHTYAGQSTAHVHERFILKEPLTKGKGKLVGWYENDQFIWKQESTITIPQVIIGITIVTFAGMLYRKIKSQEEDNKEKVKPTQDLTVNV